MLESAYQSAYDGYEYAQEHADDFDQGGVSLEPKKDNTILTITSSRGMQVQQTLRESLVVITATLCSLQQSIAQAYRKDKCHTAVQTKDRKPAKLTTSSTPVIIVSKAIPLENGNDSAVGTISPVLHHSLRKHCTNRFASIMALLLR